MEFYTSGYDKYFLERIVIPYFHSVYHGLIARGHKDYLSVNKTREYLNMPYLLGQRICNLINANGDERIDPDEFVKFFLQATMGTK